MGNNKPGLSAMEWCAVGLLCCGVVIPSLFASVFMVTNHISDPKIYVAMLISTLFAFAVVSTIGIMIACGLGRLTLPSGLLNWLGGATVGEIAGMLYVIIKKFYA